METGIIYQNPSRTTTLIDLPTSLRVATGAADHAIFAQPLSCPPRASPYPSLEPKSDLKRDQLAQKVDPKTREADAAVRDYLHRCLQEIKTTHNGPWYLRRRVPDGSPSRPHVVPRKRPAAAEADQLKSPDGYDPSELDLCAFGANFSAIAKYQDEELIFLRPSEDPSPGFDLCTIINRAVSNAEKNACVLTLDGGRPYIVPSRSSFMLASVEDSLHIFSDAALKLIPPRSFTAKAGQFDFILLDPPWTNRSAKRAKTYAVDDYRDRFSSKWYKPLETGLARHIPPGGLVGIWITNRHEVRLQALALFQKWNVRLQEEWVWLKITDQGEPITKLDGLWRKPYETLLLGRCEISSLSSDSQKSTLNRRVILGVPDLHSRKPNLKELIEPYMNNAHDYYALEVFARNLTADWWAWGNEVLKFNWAGHWASLSADSNSPAPKLS